MVRIADFDLHGAKARRKSKRKIGASRVAWFINIRCFAPAGGTPALPGIALRGFMWVGSFPIAPASGRSPRRCVFAMGALRGLVWRVRVRSAHSKSDARSPHSRRLVGASRLGFMIFRCFTPADGTSALPGNALRGVGFYDFPVLRTGGRDARAPRMGALHDLAIFGAIVLVNWLGWLLVSLQ